MSLSKCRWRCEAQYSFPFFVLQGVILFLTQAAAGTTPKVICGTPLPTFLNVFSPGAAAAVGPNVVSDILSLNGKKDAYGQTINLRPI